MKQDIYLKVLKSWFQFEGVKPRKGKMLHFKKKYDGWYECEGALIWHEVIQDWITKKYVEAIRHEDMYEDWSIPVDWDAVDPEYIKSLQDG